MGLRFLVVDDSRFSRAKISTLIKDIGHEIVGEAEDGLKAVEQYKKLKPDFITMDLEMPNMNGIEAAKEILQTNPDVNILLITSIVDKKRVLSALRLGIREILKKPITADALKRSIDAVVA